ncbi:Acetylcholine receptor subunit alpha-L1 [Eumeta japonica]|uniref:Acetylcholine receptor subunit alpha-L1 n=1 Tax=Eumeta variegata TaxID=151549 RepID=A0A4C1VWR6_EUMVA|nr:Acetylcholine receptor subunit alpha-L1 [Eumeta japonica]
MTLKDSECAPRAGGRKILMLGAGVFYGREKARIVLLAAVTRTCCGAPAPGARSLIMRYGASPRRRRRRHRHRQRRGPPRPSPLRHPYIHQPETGVANAFPVALVEIRPGKNGLIQKKWADAGRVGADGEYVVTTMTKAVLHYSGKVLWTPPAIFKSSCEIDVRYFPFDQQTCFLKFGSWSYDGDQIDLKHINQQTGDMVKVGIDLREYYPSVEWDILGVPAERHERYYPCCEQPYPGGFNCSGKEFPALKAQQVGLHNSTSHFPARGSAPPYFPQDKRPSTSHGSSLLIYTFRDKNLGEKNKRSDGSLFVYSDFRR